MRIALVASLTSPIRRAEANGPHAVILDLARALAARDHQVTVYAPAGSVADGVRIHEVPVAAMAAGAAIRFDRGADAYDRGAPADGIRALERGYERLFADVRRDAPDVVSQHAFDAAAITLAVGVPVLHTLHLPPLAADVVAAARAARAPIATVSQAARELWLSAGVRELAVLPNGVPARQPVRGSVAPVALVAGRISPEKGTDVAIRVARRAGLAVRVVGDVYDAPYHADRVAPLLRPGEWLGPLPRAELATLMARSTVLVIPVRWDEAFGLVAAEAQMAGCPVVAYRRGALPEVVEHGVGGWLVEPDDEQALVDGIARASALDRTVIRARARDRLGVNRMVAAYEAALAAIA